MSDLNRDIVYGRISDIKEETFFWGTRREILSKWGEQSTDTFVLHVTDSVGFEEWGGNLKSETLIIVEKGSGSTTFNGAETQLSEGNVVKLYPGQKVDLKSAGSMQLFVVQIPGDMQKVADAGIDIEVLQIIQSKDLKHQVYEYESLGTEIVTPPYEGGLGLLRFQFSIDKIPLHIHPNADRIIRPMKGTDDGYTYAKPGIYEMNEDTYCVFPRGTTHTNGPVPGGVYDLYAVQLPWVESHVTEDSIGGSPDFVTYVGATPPRELWKTREDFERVMERFRK